MNSFSFTCLCRATRMCDRRIRPTTCSAPFFSSLDLSLVVSRPPRRRGPIWMSWLVQVQLMGRKKWSNFSGDATQSSTESTNVARFSR